MSLPEKLLEIQRAGVELQKSAINPHFKNSYVPLEEVIEQVVPLLNEHGIVLLQNVGHYEGKPLLVTTLLDAESGTTIDSAAPLILDKETPQGVGSAITYMRRYTILSMLGLVADADDDAEAATSRTSSKAGTKRLEAVSADPGDLGL